MGQVKVDDMPHAVVGDDDSFALQPYLMKPHAMQDLQQTKDILITD